MPGWKWLDDSKVKESEDLAVTFGMVDVKGAVSEIVHDGRIGSFTKRLGGLQELWGVAVMLGAHFSFSGPG